MVVAVGDPVAVEAEGDVPVGRAEAGEPVVGTGELTRPVVELLLADGAGGRGSSVHFHRTAPAVGRAPPSSPRRHTSG